MESLIRKIEGNLCQFYAISQEVSAWDFLLEQNKAEDQVLKVIDDQGLDRDRAATLFNVSDDGSLDINIYLSDMLAKKIRLDQPLIKLHSQNLDAFCALSEEISHFHFIIDHYRRSAPFSLLELEWQGEIDRFLSAALLLKEQSGWNHHKHLLAVFFDEAFNQQYSVNKPHLVDRYREASHLARKFLTINWQGFQSPMRKAYHATWQQKNRIYYEKRLRFFVANIYLTRTTYPKFT